VEGSVRKAGNRLRITAQLVETGTGNHLWAERYDRNVEDIFTVQDEIMRTIVASLPTHVEEAEVTRALQWATESFSAYDHWLRGKHLLHGGRSREEVLRARQHFEKAVELDPNYAAAYVDLADSYYAEYQSPWTASREAAGEQVFKLSRRAVELDPRDSRTHLELAWGYLNVKGDFDLAKVQIEEALALNPNDYYNYCFGGWLATCSGDLEHALVCSNEAVRRSPLVSDGCLETRVVAEYLAGNYEESIMAFGKMLRPDRTVYGWIAAAYGQIGRAEEARAMADEFLKRVQCLPWAPKSNNADDWCQYWAVEFRAKDSAAREHLYDGLRKAGLSV
jgi:adenylate cyclase